MIRFYLVCPRIFSCSIIGGQHLSFSCEELFPPLPPWFSKMPAMPLLYIPRKSLSLFLVLLYQILHLWLLSLLVFQHLILQFDYACDYNGRLYYKDVAVGAY